jgi:hypothetical protein
MSPWYSMPNGPDASRTAAVTEAGAAVSAIGCAVRLLRLTAPSGRERELLRAIDDELGQIRQAVGVLVRR